ncbi:MULTISPECIES: archaetidylserine synthase [Methanothermobacter]|uniref:archaetidylserine synthase n=1 Tax=Methanothermobacter TaxID=145260 RepID=UPI0011CBA3A3|nr:MULTISPECIES: archaetidylserine synthase [unclassified Methanothermobacter]QEF94823.1 CDP-diacylglycerol--serine O-phosphatidyltransferase [Methanothermobacter sp. KEPCO-1]QHN07957.1 CDP-diacylglycerol--serine O-phosphatidyltransferase [Methanothermobacter sp. THM-2]
MNDKKITSFISLPDVLSILNASSGYFSILMSIQGAFSAASILMLSAVIFDSLDGWVARRTGRVDIHGFGKNMDSLSDVISFGVAPAIFIYLTSAHFRYINILVGLLIVICGILRLSRFNVLTGGGKNFTGLPIPVAAVVVSSFYLTGFYSEKVVGAMLLAVGILMVSSIEYPRVGGKMASIAFILITAAIVTGITEILTVPTAIMLFMATVAYIAVPITPMRRDLNA